MSDIIRHQDKYYILATSSLADKRTNVLKEGEMFAVFDRYGDIQPIGMGEQGIFFEGTRFISYLEFRLGPQRPLLLSSTVTRNNILFNVDLTNPDTRVHEDLLLLRGTLYIHRSKFLWKGCCHENFKFWNWGLEVITFNFSVNWGADYADIFEVRGTPRKHRGFLLDPQVGLQRVILSYRGLDEIVRKTRLEFYPKPESLTGTEAKFRLSLKPKEKADFFLNIVCGTSQEVTDSFLPFRESQQEAETVYEIAQTPQCRIQTSNAQFNDWLDQSAADLHMMVTRTPYGLYPYAGIPWFSTIFGRDGIVTALETLWFNPGIVKGVLHFLAAHQARETDPLRDAEPGKILHEMRRGEMANLGEIPFGCYYGSVDSTPLFILLAGAYYERTGDRDFIEELWPAVERALLWMEEYGDRDKDGFVEYLKQSAGGLVHQGWKDSDDSVFHADGRIAQGPIALCEVQAYVYGAKIRASQMASVLGKKELSEKWAAETRLLQTNFEKYFWCEEISTYALALDGEKQPCRVRSSNAGHCLFTGIASREHALRVSQTLLAEETFSGWGIRTVGASASRYNPMSYHNGSIWPHDNALIAHGMSRYGFKEYAQIIFSALFDAALFVDSQRLPELFCGFERRRGEGPTLYPVACSPQSWAAGAVFLFLQSCLGLSINAHERKVYFAYPSLPSFLEKITLQNLRVGEGALDFYLQSHAGDVGINILRREGSLEVITLK